MKEHNLSKRRKDNTLYKLENKYLMIMVSIIPLLCHRKGEGYLFIKNRTDIYPSNLFETYVKIRKIFTKISRHIDIAGLQ